MENFIGMPTPRGVRSVQYVMFYFSLLAMSKNVKGTSILVKVLL